MIGRTSLAFAFVGFGFFVSTSSCGGVAGSPSGGGRDAGTEGGSSGSAAHDSGADGDGGPLGYDGIVLATFVQSASTAKSWGGAYQLYADFVPIPHPPWVAGAFLDAGASNGCSCSAGLGDPCPGGQPVAGTITLDGPGKTTLATVKPTGICGLPFMGVSEWSRYPGAYCPTKSLSWTPGETVTATATGGDVAGFSHSLQTGPLLAGVAPPIGDSPVTISRSKGFTIAWTPGDRGDDRVILTLEQIPQGPPTVCTCSAPDAAGHLTIDSELLSVFYEGDAGPHGLQNDIILARTRTTAVREGRLSLQLVGETVLAGSVHYE